MTDKRLLAGWLWRGALILTLSCLLLATCYASVVMIQTIDTLL